MTTPAKALDELKPGDTYTSPAHGWTCFHCGETFGNQGAAALHFGGTPEATAGCLLKVRRGEEAGLLYAVRVAEQERGEALVRLNAVRLGLNKEMEEESVERYRATRDINWPSSLPDAPRGREDWQDGEREAVARALYGDGWKCCANLGPYVQAAINELTEGRELISMFPEDLVEHHLDLIEQRGRKPAILALPLATPRPVEIEEVTAGREGVREALERTQFNFAWALNNVLCEIIEGGADESRTIAAKVAAHPEIKKWLAALPQDTADRTGAERCPSCERTDVEYSSSTWKFKCSDPWHGDDHLRAKTRTTAARAERREISQHVGWLKQYIDGMDETNWRDMRLHAERQLEKLSAALSLHDGEKG